MTTYHLTMVCLVALGGPLGSAIMFILLRIEKRLDGMVPRVEYDENKKAVWHAIEAQNARI